MVIGRSSADLGQTKPGTDSLANPNAHFSILLFLALFASLMRRSALFTSLMPPRRRACPSMGGCTTVERLLGGALPTHTLKIQERRYVLAVNDPAA
jgi:hypothetical protein